MKKTVILLILLFSSLHIYAQQQENQLYELINVSLEKYLEIKQFPKDKQRKPIDLSKVYLNTITIRFVDFGVRARGKRVHMQPGTDSTYLWTYSCEMGEWELVSMDYK